MREARRWLKKFVRNPETMAKSSWNGDQRASNDITIDGKLSEIHREEQFLYIFHEVGGRGDLSKIYSGLNLWSLHPNMSHQFPLSQMHCYWKRHLCFSTAWNKRHNTKWRRKKKNHRRRNVCQMETLWKEKFHVQVPGSLNETDFNSESAIPGERQLVPFARRSPWSFCYDDEAFPGGQGVVISHPPHSPDLAPADLLPFLKMKTSLKGRIIQDTGRHQTKLH